MKRQVMYVQFKSKPEMWVKEYSGKKNNTLRKDERGDPRFDDLQEMMETGSYGMIRIVNTETGHYFSRQIKDVTLWEGWWIITWRA